MTPISKPLKRKTVAPFRTYGNGNRPIVIELWPGDLIRLRLLGQRESSALYIEISSLYYELVKRRALAARLERHRQRKQRRKEHRK